MSEKITFGELIEAIAEETDRSKQFTHDFLKDFVDVINGGLEEDGKVNIAGFGKFELRRVDEREGFNPQTEEKITIPAHNKVVFKPYKDLRELVNAPYAHIEPKLIEQDPSTTSDEDNSTEQSQASDDSTEKETQDLTPEVSSEKPSQSTKLSDDQEGGADDEQSEDDFIPTAPPTSHSESQDTLEDDPFGFDENRNSEDTENENALKEQSNSSESEDNGDIVEFNSAESSDDNIQDEVLDSFIGSEEEQDSDSKNEEKNKTDADNDPESQEPADLEEEIQEDESTEKNEEDVLAEEVEKLEDTAEKIKQEHTDEQEAEGSSENTGPSKKSGKSSVYPYVAAAVVILALIASGAWYFNTLSTNDTTMISSSETTTETTADRQQNNDSQQETAGEQQSTSTQSQQQASVSHNQSTTNAGGSASVPTQQQQNEAAIQLEKGQTLWSLAEERYGNPRLWPWIYGKNESIEDPDVIYAGNSLSIPLPSGPQNKLNATDSVGVAKGFLATYKWYKSNEEEQAKNHLWAAKSYHTNLQQIADIPIDQADLSYVNKAR